MDYLSEFRQMIYPNPCYGRLKFSLDQVEGEKQAEMTVFTARGNSVFRKSLDLSNQTTFEIDISGLPSGIYYLGLNTGKSWLYDRFVKLIQQHP
jgi:hypothetical protein